MTTPLIQPQKTTVKDGDGNEKEFILHKLPAIDGREVAAKYPMSNIPKIGEYDVSEEIMLKLMSFVAIETETGALPLSSKALVNNHVPDAEALFRLEAAMLDYNFGFFRRAASLDFLEELKVKAAPLVTKILTVLSEQSSPKKPQRSKN